MKMFFAAVFLFPIFLYGGTVMQEDPMNNLSNWRYFEKKPSIVGTVEVKKGTIVLKADRGRKLFLYRKSAGIVLPGETLRITFRARGKGCVSYFALFRTKEKKEIRKDYDIFAVKTGEWKEFTEEIEVEPGAGTALIRLNVWGPAEIEADHFRIERITK